jgi:sulfite reductase beta subunit-like hemoprotein
MMAKRSDTESKVEIAKRNSDHLRGTLKETLAADQPNFGEDDVQVLKFHGIYQQYDRDDRRAGGKGKGERQYAFMVRVKIPGGRITADQYLALDGVADRLANGTLRITSRQGLQYHGVRKSGLRDTIRGIHETLLSTLAACGDVERNVMACPAPIADGPHREVHALAAAIARELCPQSTAYHEIWLDGEKVELDPPAPANGEPFYGDVYLPRKFKTGITLPDDNSIDVYTQDVGLVAIPEGDRLRGVNLLVGGGLGMTAGKADTFSRKATPLGFVDIPHAVEAVRTVAAIFRDHGNRADRRHARLKYLIEEWGEARFREEFVNRFPHPLHAAVDVGPIAYNDYAGLHPQGDGRYFYGLIVENGRLADVEGGLQYRTALRTLVEELRPGLVLTPAQNVYLTDLPADAGPRIESLLDAHRVPRPQTVSLVRRFALACPALPTCGLALADAERVMPDVLDAFEAELARLGLADARITIRMTGCPNGCARPYTADIGLVGRAPGFYGIYLGGRLAGDRLAEPVRDRVLLADILPTLRPLLEEWRDRRQPDEGFGDYYNRVHGPADERILLTGERAKSQ